jgi:hypothetical protein
MPIGFPGTAQVINLNPRPQTLFYQPPQNGNNIYFSIVTLSTNQIDTNALRMSLNGADVSSQLVISAGDDSLPGGAGCKYFVRYSGILATNTIYNGQIVVVDTSGKGTTNNWVFDTFKTNGAIVIEAEDYNYNSGLFQNNPPVSGYDEDGNQINGGGYGYVELRGLLKLISMMRMKVGFLMKESSIATATLWARSKV